MYCSALTHLVIVIASLPALTASLGKSLQDLLSRRMKMHHKISGSRFLHHLRRNRPGYGTSHRKWSDPRMAVRDTSVRVTRSGSRSSRQHWARADRAPSAPSSAAQFWTEAFLFRRAREAGRRESPPALPLHHLLVRHPHDGLHLLGLVVFQGEIQLSQCTALRHEQHKWHRVPHELRCLRLDRGARRSRQLGWGAVSAAGLSPG